MSPSSPTSWLEARWRRALPAAIGALAALAAFTASAGAEEIHTSQATRAAADASTWAPLGSTPAAVCLVDTGVTPNPDTSNVVTRLAVDGGAGDDADANGHGTLMAMLIGAPLNDWGMVGIAPDVPIVSVRAERPGEKGFRFDDYKAGIQLCRQNAAQFNIRVINLSLGGQGSPTPSSLAQLSDAVDAARAQGISVVAAAGNQPGPVDYPASYGPILSVGAIDGQNALCSFSASGPGVDIYAPGCDDDAAIPASGHAAWANGTSEATAIQSGVLAQLYSLKPDLTPDQAEGLVMASASTTAAGPALNVAAAWHGAGLDEQLAAGAALSPRDAVPSSDPPRTTPDVPTGEPTPSPAPSVPSTTPAPPPRVITITKTVTITTPLDPPAIAKPRRVKAWPRPRVRSLAYGHGTVRLTTTKPPKGARIVVRLSGLDSRHELRRWTRTFRSSTGRIRSRIRAWDGATVTIEGRGRAVSPAVNVRPRGCKRGC